MSPQAFVPINRRPKSEAAVKPMAPAATSSKARPSAKPVAKAPAKATPKSSRPQAFPVLPAVAAVLVLLGMSQIGLWWWNTHEKAASAKVSSSQPASHSVSTSALTPLPTSANTLRAVPLPQNLQFGDALGRVTVTIFTDPSCGRCREVVRNLSAGLPVQGVRYVHKFWPVSAERTTPGLLVELARRNSVVPAFWKALQGEAAQDLDDTRMLQMLDAAGVPLAEQREALANDNGGLLAALEPDMSLARDAGLPPPPVVVVDDMVLAPNGLTPASLKGYIESRLAMRQQRNPADLPVRRQN